MEINLNYVHARHMGYGRLGVCLAEALTAKGVDVYDHMPVPPGVDFDLFEAEGRREGTAGSACWVSVPTHATGWWDSQHVSIFTMWEAMRLPEQFRESLHHFDTVLVPSDQNVELFSRYHHNVKRVLLGVDPDDWHYVPRKPPGLFFDFLIGGSGARKGTDLAFDAFRLAFPDVGDAPIPRLIMKNPKGETFHYDGRVIVMPGGFEPDEEIALYENAHCYLQPSRGEGFGLQPLQALAQGLPTILTDAHGHESFAHLGHGISATPKESAYFIYGDAGQWWEPNLDELVDQMRWVYGNYDEACAKAKVAAEVIAQDFTWANTAEQFLDAVPMDGPSLPATGVERVYGPARSGWKRVLDRRWPRYEDHALYGNWVSPSPLKYRIRTTQTMACEIGGRRLKFLSGVDYWDLGDVKRIFAEAGILDHDCMVGEDCGLTDEQVSRLGKPKAGAYHGDPDLTLWHAGAV